MLPRFALISLSLASLAAPAIQAQVPERMARPVPAGSPIIATPAPAEGTQTLARPMAGPTNLTATGTPATASLRWDAAPGASGYHVSRADAAGASVRLTANPIAATSFEDASGGVKPGIGYTYHVTAMHPNGGSGSAQVSFTPPAPAVPDSVRVELRGAESVLLWGAVPGAGSYQIFESWMQAVTVPTYSTYLLGRRHADHRHQLHHPIRPDDPDACRAHAAVVPVARHGAKGHRFDVGASYPPSGVTAPRAQWKYVVVR